MPEKTMTRVIIVGSKGRMGQALAKCTPHHEGLELAARISRGDDLAVALPGGDVVIDFSSHVNTVEVAQLCARHKKALIIGTTGLTDTDTFEIKKLETKIPIVMASNFSTGVNTLF